MIQPLTVQGSLLLVPAYLKFGRRPIMLLSMLMVRVTPFEDRIMGNQIADESSTSLVLSEPHKLQPTVA